MADLKFHCPECDQRLVVDDSAAGVQIDCPQCQSALLVPSASGAAVKVVARRRIAVPAGAAGSAYEELERKQSELAHALEEAAKLRLESERSKSELVQLRQDLAKAADRSVVPAGVSAAERALQENEQLRAQVAEVEAARDLLAARVAALDVPVPPAPIAVEGTALADWRQQIDTLRGEVMRAEVALSAVTSERDRLKVETVQATEALRDFETAKATLLRREARIDELTASEAAIRRECEELRTQAAQVQTQAEEHAKAGQEHHAAVAALQLQLASASADHEARLRQLNEQQDAVSNLTLVNYAALQQAEDSRAQVARLTDELKSRTNERDQASQALADREDSLRAASLTMDAAKREMERLNQDASASSHEHAQLRGQFDEVAEEARELQLRVDSLLDALHAREREVAEGRELLMRTTGERETARQKQAEKEAELREATARVEATHRYAESKLLETQQDAEAKVEAAQRDAESRVANAQRAMDELLAAKQDLEAKFAGTEAMVADGTARFEALRQASDAERGASARERDDLRQRVEQLLHDLQARESDLAEAARKLQAGVSVEEALHLQLGARSEEIARLGSELETARRELRERLESSREDAARAQREAEANLAGVHREHEIRLGAQQAAAALATHAAEEDRQRLERELSETKKQAEALDARGASLLADLQRAERSGGQIRAELQAAQRAQKQLAEESAAKEKQIAEMLAQLAAAQETEKGLRARAAEVEQDFRTRLEAAGKSFEEARRVTAERDRVAEELRRARADLVAFNETVRGARQERDAMRLNVDSMELQLEESLDQIHAGEAERDALKAELEAVRAGLERAKQHVNVLQSRRDQMREEIARLKVQLGQAPDALP